MDDSESLRNVFANARTGESWRDPIVESLRNKVRSALVGRQGEPPRIDRFEIVEQIGEGGMGVVYAAHDPKLDRDIALKVVRGGDARVLDEARALAKLSHPNVVAVYDADVVGNDVFIAMELVRGETARERTWGSWQDAVRVYREAGRGLAAAHAAGIVHGDFKPANVIAGDDGRVRVLDFGLAHDDGGGSPGGTPAYMAPEQRAGKRCDARSDQFSFCVALYEAIYGDRPRECAEDPPIDRKLAPVRSAPRQVRRALARGLSTDPARRFPAMSDLLDALDVPRRKKRWRMLALSSVLVVGAGLAWSQRDDAAADPCAGGAPRVAVTWNAHHAALTRRAFEATGRYHARDSAALVIAQLDAYTAALNDSHRDSCEVERADPLESPRLHDLRTECVSQRLDALTALVAMFERADAAVVDRAVQAVHSLPQVADCRRSEVLLARPALPADPDARRRIDDSAAMLARANALHEAGKYKEAAPLVAEALSAARAAKTAQIEAEALYLTGMVQSKQSSQVVADATFEECTRAAERAGDDALAARAWSQLTTTAARQAKFDEGIARAELARAKLVRVADRQALEAAIDVNLGLLYKERGTFDKAQQLLTRALERYEAIDPDRPRVVSTLTALASVHALRGAYGEARAFSERAVERAERVLGSSHPVTASALQQYANALGRLGDHERAITVGERVLAILRDSHGVDSDGVAAAQHNLGLDQLMLRRFEAAERGFREAIRIREKLYGADHISIAKSSASLASVMIERGEKIEARALLERTLALNAKAYGEPDVRTNIARFQLANALHALGDYDAAIREHTIARDAFAKALGADHPKIAMTELSIGQAHAAKRDLRAGLPHVERSVALYEPRGTPIDLAHARRTLAQILWGLGREPDRAMKLATEARATYAKSGAGYAEILRELDALIRAHRLGNL